MKESTKTTELTQIKKYLYVFIYRNVGRVSILYHGLENELMQNAYNRTANHDKKEAEFFFMPKPFFRPKSFVTSESAYRGAD